MTKLTDPVPDSAVIADTMRAAADAARTHTLSFFRTELSVDNKLATGFDPVTEADRAAETAIRQVIESTFPDHAITGEEWVAKDTDSAFRWIIDPIDGTRAFISGVPVWGTLIGLTRNGEAIAGLMEQPFTGESWAAVDGSVRFERAGETSTPATSNVERLALARATTTAPELFAGGHHMAWEAIRDRVLQVRYGLDCYGYCL